MPQRQLTSAHDEATRAQQFQLASGGVLQWSAHQSTRVRSSIARYVRATGRPHVLLRGGDFFFTTPVTEKENV